MRSRTSRAAVEPRGGTRPLHVLVATDGSPHARAALGAAIAFPWPRTARASGLVARVEIGMRAIPAEWPAGVRDAVDRSWERVRTEAARVLGRRWPQAEVTVVNRPPVDAILGEARRRKADVIVVGSRGHGLLGRMMLGSVSRGVVRRATCPVLVVKRRMADVRRVVVGSDGSANARQAVEFLARLDPPPGSQVTVLRIVEPVRLPSLGLVPGPVREAVAGQAEALIARSVRTAAEDAGAAAARLGRRGWKAEPLVRQGAPLAELTRAVTEARADLLVIGARGVGGVARLLLGSVAEGALGRVPVSVLLVK